MPNVSVIIPFYNVEEYLPKCLDSVVNQTLQDIEIICVDDGSTDSSAAIVEAYRERHSNITLLRQKNSGVSIARNAGLDIATGEYIYFLDSDDALELHGLERLYDVASAGKLDILLFNTKSITSSKSLERICHSEAVLFTREKDYSGLCTGQEMFLRTFPDGKHYPVVWVYLLRREFLLEQQLQFYPGIIIEDVPYMFRCMMLAQRVDYIPDQLHVRNVREGSVMTSGRYIRHLEGYAVGYCDTLSFLQDVQLREDVAALMDEFLHSSYCVALRNVWKHLSEEERQKNFRHGGIAAAHILETLRREQQAMYTAAHYVRLQQQTESLTRQRDRLQQRVEVLTQQRDRLQQRIEVLTQQRDRLKARSEDLQRQLKRSPVARLKSLFRAILRRIRKPK